MNFISISVSTWIGGILGVFLAFGINAVLIQISINPYFNLYYGILFLMLGFLLIYRINQKNKIQAASSSSGGNSSNPNQPTSPIFNRGNGQTARGSSSQYNITDKKQTYQYQLIHNTQHSTDSYILSEENNRLMVKINQIIQFVFSIFVFTSSFLCFTLEKDWFKNIPAKTKIPSYSIIGISIAFSCIYSIIDLIQVIKDQTQQIYNRYFAPMKKTKKPLEPTDIIVTNIQIYLLLSVSFIMGSLFGAIFGIIDVEDYYKNSFVLYTVLTKEISMCEPIGLIFGAFTGFMIEFLRQQEMLSRPNQPITQHFADSDEEKENQSFSETRRETAEKLQNLKEDSDDEELEEHQILLKD